MNEPVSIVLATLNAKFIHSAFGLRYLLANLGDLRGRAALMEFEVAQRPLEIELWYPMSDADTRRLMEGMAAMWRATLGARVDIVPEEWRAFQDKLSKLLAVDVTSGKTVWETPREMPNSWSTPIVIAKRVAAESPSASVAVAAKSSRSVPAKCGGGGSVRFAGSASLPWSARCSPPR